MQQHAASFIAHTEASTGAELPRFIKDEFDAFLECGILADGFLRLRCGECGHATLLAFSCKRRGICPSCGARAVSELITPVLQVVQRVVTRHLLDRTGLKANEGHGGAVTLIHRFGSAANLNIHLHCLVLDGVYRCGDDGVPVFIEVDAPTDDELHALLHTLITRLMKLLTRRGVLVEDMGQPYLAEPDTDGDEARTLRPLQAAAVTYRIALGPRAGHKVLTLRGAMPCETAPRQPLCADIDGFSLYAAVRVEANDRKRLEQLCRYITRPALSDERVQLNAALQVVLKLKTPRRDGTTHLVMSPLEFMQRLAALVPRPRLHLIRFHGAGTQRQAPGPGGASGAGGAGTGDRSRGRHRMRTRARPGSAAPPQLGPLAQARVRLRHAALPELRRRRPQDHRGHPATAGDREDPPALGVGTAAAAQGAGARAGAASSGLSRSRRRVRAMTPARRRAPGRESGRCWASREYDDQCDRVNPASEAADAAAGRSENPSPRPERRLARQPQGTSWLCGPVLVRSGPVSGPIEGG